MCSLLNWNGVENYEKILSLLLLVALLLLICACGAKEIEKNDDGF